MKENNAEDGGYTSITFKETRKMSFSEDDLDLKVQVYLKTVREGVEVISARIAMAAAKGIFLTYNTSMLAEFQGHVKLDRHWAYSLLHRVKFVQMKATTAKSKHRRL